MVDGDGPAPGSEAPRWPAVSVVIPTAGRPEMLHRAVAAVVSQDYPGDIECLIVFDGIGVNLPMVPVRPRRSVKGYANTRTAGLTGARNLGAAAASGELIAFCDDDDTWMPAKLTKQIAALHEVPEASAGSCWNIVEYAGSHIVRRCKPLICFDDLLGSRVATLHSSTIVVRRSTYFDEVGPVDESIPGGASEDYEWLLRASRRGPIVVVPECLVEILWHAGSLYSKRWEFFVAGLEHVLERNPEFDRAPRGAARVFGQIAFGYGALGRRRQCLRWARRSVRADWRQPRAYLAGAVAFRIVDANWLLHRLQLRGKGI